MIKIEKECVVRFDRRVRLGRSVQYTLASAVTGALVLFLFFETSAQSCVADPGFRSFEDSWEAFNSVDFSSVDHPAWWHGYDRWYGPDSSPVVGISFSNRNPEFISTRLVCKPTGDRRYKITVVFKPINTATDIPDWISFAFLRHSFQKPSAVEPWQIHCLSVKEAVQEGEWFVAEGVFSGEDKRWLILGPLLEQARFHGHESQACLIILSEIRVDALN